MDAQLAKKASTLFLKALIIGVLLHLGIAFTVVDSPSTPPTVSHSATVAEPPAR